MVFTLVMVETHFKEEYFMICEYYMKFKFQETFTEIQPLIHLHIVYGCFWAIAAELRNCDRDHIVHKA